MKVNNIRLMQANMEEGTDLSTASDPAPNPTPADEDNAPIGLDEAAIADVFQAMAGELDEDDTLVTAKSAATEEPAQPVVENKPAEPAPTPTPAAPPVPAAAAPTEPAKVEQPAQGGEPAPTPTPTLVKTVEELNKEYADWLQTAEKQLAEQYYKLDDETAAKYEASPAEVLPQLMARTHMAVQEVVMRTLAVKLPELIEYVQSTKQETNRVTTKFFDKWPGLVERKDTVVSDAIPLINQFRQTKPDITEDELIQKVGATLHVIYGVPIPGMEATPPATPANNLPPARPAGGTPRRAADPTKTPAAPSSWTESFASELLQDD